ncbi:UNKNOWN [Stylonychia lemnae]|uniref:Uncharacterized protein n=1 Tax=Stylonychia lemnae TaxID=5949 RepID=A0A078A0V1_STYLE|nr:UNKNOWN [Stylonychia lemnae]|eukprot:CDW75816.1 UNKNOWN [Stylonychia lemnae]
MAFQQSPSQKRQILEQTSVSPAAQDSNPDNLDTDRKAQLIQMKKLQKEQHEIDSWLRFIESILYSYDKDNQSMKRSIPVTVRNKNDIVKDMVQYDQAIEKVKQAIFIAQQQNRDQSYTRQSSDPQSNQTDSESLHKTSVLNKQIEKKYNITNSNVTNNKNLQSSDKIYIINETIESYRNNSTSRNERGTLTQSKSQIQSVSHRSKEDKYALNKLVSGTGVIATNSLNNLPHGTLSNLDQAKAQFISSQRTNFSNLDIRNRLGDQAQSIKKVDLVLENQKHIQRHFKDMLVPNKDAASSFFNNRKSKFQKRASQETFKTQNDQLIGMQIRKDFTPKSIRAQAQNDVTFNATERQLLSRAMMFSENSSQYKVLKSNILQPQLTGYVDYSYKQPKSDDQEESLVFQDKSHRESIGIIQFKNLETFKNYLNSKSSYRPRDSFTQDFNKNQIDRNKVLKSIRELSLDRFKHLDQKNNKSKTQTNFNKLANLNNLSPSGAGTSGMQNDKNKSFGSFVNSFLNNTQMPPNYIKKSKYKDKNSKSVLLSKDASQKQQKIIDIRIDNEPIDSALSLEDNNINTVYKESQKALSTDTQNQSILYLNNVLSSKNLIISNATPTDLNQLKNLVFYKTSHNKYRSNLQIEENIDKDSHDKQRQILRSQHDSKVQKYAHRFASQGSDQIYIKEEEIQEQIQQLKLIKSKRNIISRVSKRRRIDLKSNQVIETPKKNTPDTTAAVKGSDQSRLIVYDREQKRNSMGAMEETKLKKDMRKFKLDFPQQTFKSNKAIQKISNHNQISQGSFISIQDQQQQIQNYQKSFLSSNDQRDLNSLKETAQLATSSNFRDTLKFLAKGDNMNYSYQNKYKAKKNSQRYHNIQ